MDGKNRIIVVKDETGALKGRCILRMLIDKVTGKPILFRERLYINNNDPIVEELVKKMCLRRAETLGLQMVGFEVEAGAEKHKNTVESLSCIAPFEYVDAEGIGVVSNPTFEITNSYVYRS